ncbi:Putative F0F1-ATPase subunit Ca2+/Mg2+ transporter [Lutibacter oricola]|uniref:Putative F0F1-ATPase subunit Ca2+/Mg2+ transporter n=1 Tax=Lutibacter oricola TaxID=762486 RepID=A0A1H2RCI3_9FLAO|nr:AtpZ/AtpI family protein [Lutibacter oricola]SDW17127.1 Putative F0F1-ATPase subunit Ca2+/Mg2+ transporter [Lutibacter oricola]
MTKPKKKNQLHKFAQLSGIAFQMGITIYLGAYFGKKLDAYFETTNKIYTLVLTLLALALSIYSVLLQLKKINDKYE